MIQPSLDSHTPLKLGWSWIKGRHFPSYQTLVVLSTSRNCQPILGRTKTPFSLRKMWPAGVGLLFASGGGSEKECRETLDVTGLVCWFEGRLPLLIGVCRLLLRFSAPMSIAAFRFRSPVLMAGTPSAWIVLWSMVPRGCSSLSSILTLGSRLPSLGTRLPLRIGSRLGLAKASSTSIRLVISSWPILPSKTKSIVLSKRHQLV